MKVRTVILPVLALGLLTACTESEQSRARSKAKEAGQEIKEGLKDVKEEAKEAGREVKKELKEVGKEIKKGIPDGDADRQKR